MQLTLFTVCQSSLSLTAKISLTGKKEKNNAEAIKPINILSITYQYPQSYQYPQLVYSSLKLLSFKSQLQIHPITICENALLMKLKDISHYNKRNHLRMFAMGVSCTGGWW